MALNTQFIPTFFAGGHSHFVNPQLEINRLYRSILASNGNFVSLIGETLLICSEERRRKKLPSAEKVKHVQLAGGFISSRHIDLARELFPNALIHKGYGLTEAIRVTMINHLDPDFNSSTVGRPLPFVEIEILGSNGVVKNPFEFGEIHVKGPNVLLGISNSLATPTEGNGFLATGDIGYWNEKGLLCVSGRKDGLFKINGNKVSSFEIEKMAIETSDMIRNAKCVAIDDIRRGGSKLILMLEIPVDLQSDFLSQVFQNMQKNMYQKLKMLPYFPKEIAILDHFPRTSNGKLAVSRLTDIYLNSKKAIVCENPDSNLQFFRIAAA